MKSSAVFAITDEVEDPADRPRRLSWELHPTPTLDPMIGGLSSAAFAQPGMPTWLNATISKLEELLGLASGWDGHDGSAANPDIVNFTIHFLLETLDPAAPAPNIVPLSSGGVQLEWHDHYVDLEIEIEAPNRLFASFENYDQPNQSFERPFGVDYTQLAKAMKSIASR